MGKALTPVDHFYIDNHKDLNARQLAKHIGCTERTIYNYLQKTRKHSRSEPATEVAKIEAAPVTTPKPVSPILNLIQKQKHGDGGAVTMTAEASMYSDELRHMDCGNKHPDYIHVINPEKKD